MEYSPHAALKRLKLTWYTYGFGGMILCLSAAMGLVPVWSALIQVAYHWSGQLVFYARLRSGSSRQHADAGLVFEQLLFGISAIVLSYALTPQARGAALQLLCLALVFDMQRLSPRQLAVAAWGAVGLLVLTMLLVWVLQPEGFQPRREMLNLVMAAVQLPALTLIARDVRQMREKQLLQRVDLQQALDRLKDLSEHDSLTGLANRRHMTHLLDQERKRFARHGRPFGLAILDIDHFKQINDRFGHVVGDTVLKTFAQLATTHLPKADTLARWGGEEFLLLLPEQNAYGAAPVIEQLRRTVEQHDWGAIAPGLAVRFSAGITDHGNPSDAAHQLVERADLALYQAKAHGRNQVRCQPCPARGEAPA